MIVDLRNLTNTQKEFIIEVVKFMEKNPGISIFKAINIVCNLICPSQFKQKDTNFSDITYAFTRFNKIRKGGA